MIKIFFQSKGYKHSTGWRWDLRIHFFGGFWRGWRRRSPRDLIPTERPSYCQRILCWTSLYCKRKVIILFCFAIKRSIFWFQKKLTFRPLNELEIVWLKDDQPLSLAGIDYESVDLFNRTLALRQASWSHEGVYSCIVRMKTGGPVLTKSATVTIIGERLFSMLQKKTVWN